MSDTEISATKEWLITGSTRELGRTLAEAVLAAGHNLVATGRNPAHLKDLVARYGDQVRAIALDVTSEQAAARAVAETVKASGVWMWLPTMRAMATFAQSKIPAWPNS